VAVDGTQYWKCHVPCCWWYQDPLHVTDGSGMRSMPSRTFSGQFDAVVQGRAKGKIHTVFIPDFFFSNLPSSPSNKKHFDILPNTGVFLYFARLTMASRAIFWRNRRAKTSDTLALSGQPYTWKRLADLLPRRLPVVRDSLYDTLHNR